MSKSKAMLWGLIGMFAESFTESPFMGTRTKYKFPTDEELMEKNIHLKLKRGLQYFDVNGEQILALNRKNAERKYKNMTSA